MLKLPKYTTLTYTQLFCVRDPSLVRVLFSFWSTLLMSVLDSAPLGVLYTVEFALVKFSFVAGLDAPTKLEQCCM